MNNNVYRKIKHNWPYLANNHPSIHCVRCSSNETKPVWLNMIPENPTEDINLFYEISELDRQTVLNSCQAVGRSEEEFIKDYSNTAKYAWQRFYYYLFKLCDLREFQRAILVFVIGLILILIFIK